MSLAYQKEVASHNKNELEKKLNLEITDAA